MLRHRIVFISCALFVLTLPLTGGSKKNTALALYAKICAEDTDFWQRIAQFPFGKHFKWGVATSAFQIEGDTGPHGNKCNNCWTATDLAQPGNGVDHWNRYKDDVQLIKKLGMKAYRFSIEWSKINPAPGVFDQEAMDHYVDLCRALIANGIEPIPCLFHHVWPEWFGQMGGFERQENIHYFVAFAQFVFTNLINMPGINMWMTFNEPVGYAMEGWIRGHYAPFKEKQFKLCGTVVLNMLRAHVEIYHLAHRMKNNVQVGFPHVFNPLNSYHWYNPLVEALCAQMNYLLHDVVLEFFKTGKFNWSYTFGSVKAYEPAARGALDYIGINYYSQTTLKMSLPFSIKSKYHSRTKIAGNRALYPRGLYDAIKQCAQLKVPIYITENGVNDPHDVSKDEYLRYHLAVVVRALREGYDIRGYFWWTLMDCFEWSSNGCDVHKKSKNMTPVFSSMGLYAVDMNTFKRTLRAGTQNFINFLFVVA